MSLQLHQITLTLSCEPTGRHRHQAVFFILEPDDIQSNRVNKQV